MKNILLILGLSVYIIAYAQAQDNTSDAFFNYNSSIELKNKEKLNDSPYSLFGDNTTVLKTDHERNLDHSLKIPLIEDDKTIGVFELNFQTAIATIKNLKGEIVTEQKMSLEDVARFLTIDPHSEKYYSVSPYVYVNNNPLRFIDPTGMDWIEHKKTGDVEWRHDINQDNVPKGYNYIGTEYQGISIISFEKNEYDTKEGRFSQLAIEIGYKDPNTGKQSSYNWVQTVTANPSEKMQQPFIDYADWKSEGRENFPYYQTKSENIAHRNDRGYDVTFEDAPWRNTAQDVNWSAEISLVGDPIATQRGNKSYPVHLGVYGQNIHNPIITLNYGFTVKNRNMTPAPVRVISPSAFHMQAISKIK